MPLTALLLAAGLCRAQPVQGAPELDYAKPLNAVLYADLDAQWGRRREPGILDAQIMRLGQENSKSPFDTQLLWRYGRALVTSAEQSPSIWARHKYYAKAVDVLDTALDIDPECVDARYWKVRALLRREPKESEVTAIYTTLSKLDR